MRCVAGVMLLLAACTACAAAALTVPFSTLAKGLASGVDQPTRIVVRSQNDWAALWSRHMRTPAAPPPPPSVDFSRDMVAALFMGERPTGGYAIEVTQIERTDAGLSIRYRTTRPDPAGMYTQALTQPFHLITLPRVDGPVTFVSESASQ
ncbi:MAG: protease complex subunit PrcB family protein [Candidatus Rokuibacteriota bacterium]